MKAYLESDVVSMIVRGDALSEYDAINHLLTAYHQGKIELFTSHVTHDEIKGYHGTTHAHAERMFQLLEKIPIAPWDLLVGVNVIEKDAAYAALLKLGLPEVEAKHVLAAANGLFGYFLTFHLSILSHAADIKALCGVDVQRPSDFVATQGW